MEHNNPQLACRNLSLGYGGKTVASGLSFSVNAGDYLCIVGENGSGKSTLMRTMLKLQSPITGRIETGDGLRYNDIGYMPQKTIIHNDFPATVREVVHSGFLNHRGLRPYYNTWEKTAAMDIMRLFGVASLAGQCYRELSGGQQKRVLLARALCAARKILMLDEPAAGLDPTAAAEMYDTLNNINTKGTTIIMISHDVASSITFASHILHIGDQASLFFGTVSEYAQSDAGRVYAGFADYRDSVFVSEPADAAPDSLLGAAGGGRT